MAVTYQQLFHNVALRLSALVGTQTTPANTTYNQSTLLSIDLKSVDWPFASFQHAILMAEEQFADVAASCVDSSGVGNHPWRASMGGVTAPILNGGLIPSADSGANRIIGAYGEAVDSVDNSPLTKRPLDEVRRLASEVLGWRDYPMYFYNISGRRAFHTRTSIILGVCVYNRTTQAAAFAANSGMLLPDTAEPGITSLAVSLMTKDGAFYEQATVYHGYATEALAIVGKGGIPSVVA